MNRQGTRMRRSAAPQRRLLAAVAAALLLAGCGAADSDPVADGVGGIIRQLSFTEPAGFSAGTVPWLVVTGDVNGDGRPDVVTANVGLGNAGVSVVLNQTEPGAESPSFAAPRHLATGILTGIGTLGVALGDINGDGLVDIIAANSITAPAAAISVFISRTPRGSSELAFEPARRYTAGIGASLVCPDDVNRDGRMDLIVTNSFDSPARVVSVLLNQTAAGGDLAFSAPTAFAGGSTPEGMACGDLNGDGLTDIVVGNTSSNEMTVLLNRTARGADTPDYAGPFSIASPMATAVKMADFNGDGRLDLITGEGVSGAGVNIALNLTQNGAMEPAFSELTHFDTQGCVTEDIAVADYDGDGLLDFAAANDNALFCAPRPTGVAVLANRTPRGAAKPEFTEALTYPPGIASNTIAQADFNGDGRPDLVAATPTAGAVLRVLFNTSH
ncbi:FG-GAP repeat domain-containing protein [Solimonas sp. K1W22B-7]|uniref:FG-GAP repeat domain-containing protein n=1 Tax=Solimonas sp. K1W22B-7 TaxID=2303331 RepID=UPI0013C4FED3|nr:VCBS repeat-containing protein [Solimonas sp. K1W22B-7]